MTKITKKSDYKNLLDRVSTLIEEARRSKDLTERYEKGSSKSNLFLMRKFYLTYPPQKFQTVSGKFNSGQILSWSHYCELITIKEEHARSFYEIESINNKWSVRELKRQINSLLFERLALSKDKYKLYLPTRRELEVEIRKEATRLSPIKSEKSVNEILEKEK